MMGHSERCEESRPGRFAALSVTFGPEPPPGLPFTEFVAPYPLPEKLESDVVMEICRLV